MKKVSVIIPTYGGSISLHDSVESVLRQTYPDIEIIVVDDNNPDTEARRSTESVMNSFVNETRVKYVKHDHNRNGAAARNTGFKNSCGDYICLLDDDDIFLPEKIEKQVIFLESHPEFDACYCWRVQEGKEIQATFTGDLSQQLLEQSFTPTTCALMLRRSCYLALNGFDESYRRHQDYEFLLRFFKKYRIGVVKEVLLEIRGNEIHNQLRGEKLYEMKAHFFSQFDKDIDRIDKSNPGFKKRVYASHFSSACKAFIRYGDYGLAIKAYRNYGVKGGLLFWRYFFKIINSWVVRKVGRK